MTRLLITLFVLSLGLTVNAQNQPNKRKPGFSLDEKTMTELGVTADQKKNIEDLRNQYRKLRSVYEQEVRRLDSLEAKQIDSVLTTEQKAKVAALKTAVAAENSANPSLRKSVVFNPKTMDELGISPEQQKSILAIRSANNAVRRSSGEKFGKVTSDAVQEQENVLTADQKQKIAEMKAAIAEYNKSIQ